MNFDNYRVEDLPQLSEEDQKKPYAKYYYEGRTEITDPEILEAIRPGNPMPLEDALSAEDLIRLLEPGCPQPKIGYCVRPDGIGYSCACVKMPGVTMEMRDWYMPWVYGDPGLRYKIWYPGSHEIHYHNLAVEDMGWGMCDIFQGERPDMKELGFDRDPHEINPGVIKVLARNARLRLQTEDINAQKGFVALCHLIWEIPGGTEQWSFSWTGEHFVNGRLKNRLAPDEVVTEDMARLSAAHLFYEYTRQTELLPKLFAEYGQDKGPKEPPQWPERITSALK